MSVAAAALGVSSFGSATISISSSGGNSARTPFAVSAATLPRNSALMGPPSRSRSTLRDDMQQLFAADKAVDVARRISAAAPRHSVGPRRAMRCHDDIGQFVKGVPRRWARGLGGIRVWPPDVERRSANGGLSSDLTEPDNSDRQPTELAMQRPVHDAAVAP